MRRLTLLLFAPALGACATVSSAQPGSTAVTGEAWYTTEKTFFGMSSGAAIFYCSDARPGVCVKAEIRDKSQGPPADEEAPARKRGDDDDSDAPREKPKKHGESDDEETRPEKPKKRPVGDDDSETKKEKPKKRPEGDDDSETKKEKPKKRPKDDETDKE